jgi:formylglycine-generating enzyme required for sulfatase activity
VTQNPFKRHPLPVSNDTDWGDDEPPGAEDPSEPRGPLGLSQEDEIGIYAQLVLTHLGQHRLSLHYPDKPLEALAVTDQTRKLIEAGARKLKTQRSEMAVVVELTDSGPPIESDDLPPPPVPQKFELRHFPVLVGRASEPVQIVLEDPEVPELRGYFYQLGRFILYHDLGGTGGTMLERVVGGRTQFLVLKGESCPLMPGDNLVLGSVRTSIRIRETRNAALKPSHPVIDGILPEVEPLDDVPRPAPPIPVSRKESESPPPPPPPAPRSPLWPVLAVVLAVVGFGAGRLTAPEPPPVPVPVVAQPAPAQEDSSTGLKVEGPNQLKLVNPKLSRGARFFLVSGTPGGKASDGQGIPIALGEVLDDSGTAQILYAPMGLSPESLSFAPAVEAQANDPQVSLFLALNALQAGRTDEAAQVLDILASTPNPPVAALKGKAFLALQKSNLEEASKTLEAARGAEGVDPELNFLLARIGRQRLNAMSPNDPRRAALQVEVRLYYETALALWLEPSRGPFAFQGHELGLRGEDLFADYQKLQERLASQARGEAPVQEVLAPAVLSAGKLVSGGGAPAPAALAPSAEPEPVASPIPAPAPVPTPAPAPVARAGGGGPMVRIPDGPFKMGGDISDPNDEQGLAGLVRVGSFSIDKYEVSNAQFEKVFPAHRAKRPAGSGDDAPVVNVTWAEALSYCREVGLRLPSEAEWEKAARGTDGRLYPWGDAPPSASLLNYRGTGLGRPVDVDKFDAGASPYGVLNLAGNVWEWIADYYDPRYYARAPLINPPGPTSGARRVIRGGSFQDDAADARASNRALSDPERGVNKIGFRCAKD